MTDQRTRPCGQCSALPWRPHADDCPDLIPAVLEDDPDMAALRAERDEARASVVRVGQMASDMLLLLDEVLGHFWQQGHPAEPSLRTGWVGAHKVGLWRALANTWRTALEGRPSVEVVGVAAEVERLADQLEARGQQRDVVGDDDSDGCDGDHDGVSCHTLSAVGTWFRAAEVLRARAAELRGGEDR